MAKTLTHFKRGDIVEVYNSTMSGKEFVEGNAKLVKRIRTIHENIERWIVKFLDNGDVVERNIYPKHDVV